MVQFRDIENRTEAKINVKTLGVLAVAPALSTAFRGQLPTLLRELGLGRITAWLVGTWVRDQLSGPWTL